MNPQKPRAGQGGEKVRRSVHVAGDHRLVLVNAVYLKAAWAEEFRDEPKVPFFVNGSQKIEAPGLVNEADYGHAPIPGGAAVTVP